MVSNCLKKYFCSQNGLSSPKVKNVECLKPLARISQKTVKWDFKLRSSPHVSCQSHCAPSSPSPDGQVACRDPKNTASCFPQLPRGHEQNNSLSQWRRPKKQLPRFWRFKYIKVIFEWLTRAFGHLVIRVKKKQKPSLTYRRYHLSMIYNSW